VTPAQVSQALTIAATADVPSRLLELAIVHGAVLIGSCGIRKSAADTIEAEFGCELAPAAWGHGYAAEASSAILAFGFSKLRLRRIFATTTTTNRQAIALARRLGMREEGGTGTSADSVPTIPRLLRILSPRGDASALNVAEWALPGAGIWSALFAVDVRSDRHAAAIHERAVF
jgi:hypothetical protein